MGVVIPWAGDPGPYGEKATISMSSFFPRRLPECMWCAQLLQALATRHCGFPTMMGCNPELPAITNPSPLSCFDQGIFFTATGKDTKTERVSFIPDWLSQGYVAKITLNSLCLYLMRARSIGVYHHAWYMHCWRTWGSMYVKQTFYQRSCTSSPHCSFYLTTACLGLTNHLFSLRSKGDCVV